MEYMGNMIQNVIFNRLGVDRLERLVDLASFRHKLISSNIANATSPGYQRRDIDFQSELSEALGKGHIRPKTTNSRHIVSERAAGAPEVRRLKGGVNAPEVSEVDIDKEMGQLATNTLNYDIGIKLLSKTFSGLRTAIRGRT